jgi:hypothetical protein
MFPVTPGFGEDIEGYLKDSMSSSSVGSLELKIING